MDSKGLMESTQILSRKPFLIGGALQSVLGSIPFLDAVLETLPITVGNAVLFVVYLHLFEIIPMIV
jgi:xanthine/uracil permease